MEFTSITSRYRYVDTLVSRSTSRVSQNISALSSGSRLTRAADDVAGLSIATKLRSHTTTIRSNLTNLAQADSLLQVMDGALHETTNILQRMNSIVTMANSGAISSAERGFLQIEVDGLVKEIDRLLKETNFNGVSLFGSGYRPPEAETPDADIASLYDVQGKGSGVYTVRAGDTVFSTYVDTIGEGADQENWLLIGRGRDGWEFDDDGQGDAAYLANGLGTPGAFDPIALDSASINALLQENGLTLDDIEIRIKRAADEAGQSYQELRQRPLGPQEWSWQFDKVNYDTQYDVQSSKLGAAFSDSFSSMDDTTVTLAADSGDNYQRLLTSASANANINGGIRGFQYGATVAGTTGTTDPNSFFWDSGAAGHAMPYAEVYIRVKSTVTHNTTQVADEFIDPRSIKGLELWLDANDLDGDGSAEGLNESGQAGGVVSVWKDKSGNGADLKAVVAGPTTGARTINNLNVLDFNGAQAMINIENAADLYGDEYTWYVVAQDDVPGDEDFLMYAKGGAAGLESGGNYDGYGTLAIQLEASLGFGGNSYASILFNQNGNSGLDSRIQTPQAMETGTAQIIGGDWKIGEYSTSYVNGFSSSKYLLDTLANRINGNTTTASAFTIGSNGSTNTNLSRWHDGAVAEVIVVSNRMSVDERQRLESYLAQKWGLEDELPDYHLYKSGSPTKALQMKISDAYENEGVVGNVNVNDYENVSYSIAGAYKDIFSINGETGELRVIDPSKLLDIQSKSIVLRVQIEGEGVGATPLFMPVEIALDKRFMGFQVLDGENKTLFVSVDHFNTNVLFDNQSISVLTQEATITSAALVQSAIDKTTAFRAEVGSKQSSVNILTDYNAQALRNQDNARGVIEDTDIAATSTEFATNLVKNNMAIAMAAQATQLQTEVATRIFESLGS